jgi:hypothetical protein
MPASPSNTTKDSIEKQIVHPSTGGVWGGHLPSGGLGAEPPKKKLQKNKGAWGQRLHKRKKKRKKEKYL